MASSHSDTGLTKCFAGAVRRLLCTGSLPTHPSDQIPELSAGEVKNPSKDSIGDQTRVEAAGASPGIVARLMGLDSLPESNWLPRETALNSITRSMSLNFMDYFPEFSGGQSGQHRRVRTSVSFREVPTSLHQQNHDCFVLFLENVSEAEKMGPGMGKSEVGFRDLKQKKAAERRKSEEMAVVKKKKSEENNKRASRGKNEPKSWVFGKLSSEVGTCDRAGHSGSVLLQKKNDAAASKVKSTSRKATVGSKFTKRKNKVEPFSDSVVNSSPVSVPVHQKTPLSAGHSRKMDFKRKKSSSKLADWDYPAPNLIRISNPDDQGQTALKRRVKSRQAKKDYYYTEMTSKICRLTKEDLKHSNWATKETSKPESIEEICQEFEQHILNLLLHQVTNELDEIAMKSHANFLPTM